jgi:transcriptional regulator with XRE-family HTH domain
MRMRLKLELVQRGIKQYSMAAALGMDPTRLSRIIGGRVEPSESERSAIARYLQLAEPGLFVSRTSSSQLPLGR